MAKVTSMFEGMRVVGNGEAAGIATATQFASLTCSFANFVADEGNTGVVCIGNSSGVTLSANATDATSGFQLPAATQSGWLPCTNLNNFFYICSSTVDFVGYICVG